MSIAPKVLVGITGLLLAYLAVQWMFVPAAMAETLGITLAGAPAFSAARGSIGGPLLGAAVLCALGLVTNQGRYLFAAAILARKDSAVRERLAKFREAQSAAVPETPYD